MDRTKHRSFNRQMDGPSYPEFGNCGKSADQARYEQIINTSIVWSWCHQTLPLEVQNNRGWHLSMQQQQTADNGTPNAGMPHLDKLPSSHSIKIWYIRGRSGQPGHNSWEQRPGAGLDQFRDAHF